jgi:predicted phage baseplate assembly protein
MTGCSCCTSHAVRTPGIVLNRPGLPQLSYRSGRYDDFLASMIAGLSRADRPALRALRTRDRDDPTIAVLDAWAMACDVLTFYTERLANESYLRTATERSSLAGLGALLSYRLNPGSAAETVLAFSLERPPPAPPLDPPDPGVVPPAVPQDVVLPAGMRVASVPGPDEAPQTFETVEPITARPQWNALPVVRTRPHLPVLHRRDAYLEGVGLNLHPGEPILFASTDLANDRWDVRLLTEVSEDLPARRTHVRWDRGLGSVNPPNLPAVAPSVHVLRKRLPVFGHNAPTWRAMHDSFRLGYRSQYTPVPADGTEWPFFTAAAVSGSNLVVDVDGAHPDIVTGSWLVVSQDDEGCYRELYRVVARAELSRAAFGVSGKVTRLTLAGELHTFGTPRQVTVLAVPQPLTLTEAPDDSPVAGRQLVVTGDAAGMAAGRTLVVTGTTADGADRAQVVALEAAAAAAGGRTLLTLATAIDPPLLRAGAVVLGNAARATHGESVTQVLGSGDAARRFLSAPLVQGPLTHVPADTPLGTASTLQVRVDDVAWTEVPSAYPAGPADRVFTTRTEPDGSLSVVFGDGVHGAVPPTGTNNLRATYRKGIGAAGNVRAHQLSSALDRPLGMKGVTNPAAASGGVDPEPADRARATIPLPVRTLGRAVSLLDYADFAMAFTGIGKAVASVLPLRSGPTILVSVADHEGAPPPAATVARLQAALREHGDPHARVLVLPCRSARFRLALKVGVDPARQPDAVLEAVGEALRAAYRAAGRAIGAPVHASEVTAAAAGVPGVVGIDLDRLYLGAAPALRQRLVAEPARTVAGSPLAAQLLAIAPDPFDRLERMP